MHPTDSQFLIKLICEEGPARQRLQDDIVRQLGADPAEVYMLNASPLDGELLTVDPVKSDSLSVSVGS